MKSIIFGLAPALAVATNCRYGPNEASWPKEPEWKNLNGSVHGQLIRTLPAGHVCHDPTYDEKLCKQLQKDWLDPFFKTTLVEAVMTPSFANNSCDPLGKREDPCEIGGYAQYSINITSPGDIAAGLAFVQKHNIRVVVKNTGHDFLGRSVGYGSLSLWTHNLQKKEVIHNYKSKHYNGPAVKMQAGVQVRQANEFADSHGYMMVGGECPSVGLTGGYTSGGGQSPLSSIAGLAADQTLEFEVVTADGKLRRAAPDENADLYWALSGGGPGYGVVWSVTYRVFPDSQATGNNLIFDRSNRKTAEDDYWKVVQLYHDMAPNMTDFGGYTYTGYNDTHFEMTPFFAPHKTRKEVVDFLKPLEDKLKEFGMPYTSNTTNFKGYLPAWRTYFNWEEGGLQDGHMGSRLIPRQTILKKSDEFIEVCKKITATGTFVQEMTIGATDKVASNTNNAVNPAWRKANIFFLTGASDPNATAGDPNEQVTHIFGDLLRDLAPNSGTYMNEADVYELNFEQSFYGCNYKKLLAVKDKYDPHGVFYATTGVGSDRWQPQKDGRLCRR